jgi:uncharacterized OB-fold protein
MSGEMASDIPLDEVSQYWWDATRDKRLVIQRCKACRRRQHYPRALCIHCGATDLSFEQVSGVGIVDTWTEVMRTVRPDLPAPYVIARVRLAEGPTLLTRLTGTGMTADLIGKQVRVDWSALPDGRHLPVFRISEG